MRKPLIAGNWKMYKNPAEAKKIITELKELVKDIKVDLLICPPFVDLPMAAGLLKESNIALGAQNMHWQAEGAYTGEISAAMLKDVGCSFVLCGHSERRQYFGETDETVNKKALAAIAAGLVPIVCVGETLAQKEAGQSWDAVKKQLKGSLAGWCGNGKLVIAYEPVWAIGTGKTATPADAQSIISQIRLNLKKEIGKIAESVIILYGGSVKPENIKELMACADVDGVLVGGASLEAATFAAIANY